MAATNAAAAMTMESTSDETAAKAANKRYEGLVMVRTKVMVRAWYWAHLEPILVNNLDIGLPKVVKLRCSLCDAIFSDSNPLRTASEHLKCGTCLNFASVPNPISSAPPSSSVTVATAPHANITGVSPSSPHLTHNHHKRSDEGYDPVK